MSIAGTRQLLHRWGRTSQHNPLGLPTIVAFLKERLGRSSFEPPSDPEIEAVDGIVMRAPTEHKNYLIMHHCRRDSFRRISLMMGVTKYRVGKKLDEAQWYVHTELEGLRDRTEFSINGHPGSLGSQYPLKVSP